MGNTGDSKQIEVLHKFRRHTLLHQISATGWFIEKTNQTHASLIVNGHYHVRVPEIVDPGDVLVANTLDAMSAVTIKEQSWTLQCFAGSHFAGREAFF